MKNLVLKTIVRTRFRRTPAEGAEKQTRQLLAMYLGLAECVDETSGAEPVTVPSMPGVDQDMRGWSFFSLLQHNAIVNRAISANIRRLALGEAPPEKAFDVKNDVMPSKDCGIEQVPLFEESVADHLALLPALPDLRGTLETEHPVFGSFDAHMWNCMFPFHLNIHLKQAKAVVAQATKRS